MKIKPLLQTAGVSDRLGINANLLLRQPVDVIKEGLRQSTKHNQLCCSREQVHLYMGEKQNRFMLASLM